MACLLPIPFNGALFRKNIRSGGNKVGGAVESSSVSQPTHQNKETIGVVQITDEPMNQKTAVSKRTSIKKMKLKINIVGLFWSISGIALGIAAIVLSATKLNHST